MSTVKDLIKAHRMLKEANNMLPKHVSSAATRIQAKLGIEWVDALEIVDMVLGRTVAKKKWAGPSKSHMLKAKRAGFGGNVRPKSVEEMEARAEKIKGPKRDRYLAAATLLRNRDAWVRSDEMKKLGVNLGAVNFRQLNFYLPVGMIVRSARGKGYMAQSLKEALS